MTAPQFFVREVQAYVRPVRLRMPFRFGLVTLREAPQCFVRVRIELQDARTEWGCAAELLAPKWFDKNPELSNEDNFDQLRLSLLLAADAYTHDSVPRSAFAHFVAHHVDQIAAGAAHSLNPLIANFGPAQIDRAILDALGRIADRLFYELIRRNLVGIDVALLPLALKDLAGFDTDRFLAELEPAASMAVRHTIGLLDVIGGRPRRISDGLPESLADVVASYGHRYFKVKVAGDLAADLQRLVEIATVLDGITEPYFVSLDGNEQYNDVGALIELWRLIRAKPELERFASSIRFIEQPINRAAARDCRVGPLACIRPVIIDESDDDLGAFPLAKALGYVGVSSKCCKGLYKSIFNAARCKMWNAESGGNRYFMTGEDLTTQAGLAVQQDFALANLIGLQHVERNGHHYVNGMAGLPEIEQAAFLTAHPDLYEHSHGAVRLKIRNGRVNIGSLGCAGFASIVQPEWRTLEPVIEISSTSRSH